MPAKVVVKMASGQTESPGGGQGGGAPGGGTGGHAVGGFPHNVEIPQGKKIKKLTVVDEGGQVHLDLELD